MKTLSRTEAVDLLRRKCIALTDDEHSLCEVASRLHILCGGFSRFKFHELKEKHDWIVKKRPHVTRTELEDLANRWQLARQFVNETEIACDTQARGDIHPLCQGWDTHDNAALAGFLQELTGEEYRVVDDPTREAVTGGREEPA